ncbi:MAG: S41 family peptidase [Lysobacteraceae bacterium]
MKFAATSLLILFFSLASHCAHADGPHAKETFAVIWERLQNSGFDGKQDRLDWAALKAEHQPDIEGAKDLDGLRREISELLEALKASHLELIPSSAFPKDGEAPKSGNAELGLRLAVIDRNLIVERVVPGYAAASAGIRPGWTVEKIGGFDLTKVFTSTDAGETLKPRGLTVLQLTANAMVGAIAPGTTLDLQLRDTDGKPHTIALTARDNAHTQTLQLPNLPPLPLRFESHRLPVAGGGCVLQVEYSQWAMPAYDQLMQALREHGDCRGVVIDLRGNSGGLIASLSAIGGLFVDKPVSLGTMITTGGDLRLTVLPRVVDNDGKDIRRFSGPLAILTDRGSVSCSDIFAGGMQALGRARIFGDTSAGMALPSASIPLPSGDHLLYPTADFVDPNGRRIEGVGVTPDTPSPPTVRALRDGRDPALEAALAWIGASA